MQQKLKFIFSVTTKDIDKTEKAARELTKFFNAKQSQFDTVVLNLNASQAAVLIEELFDETVRGEALNVIFDHFNIVVNGVRIDNAEGMRNKNFYRESKRVMRENRVGSNEFVPDSIDSFLQDIAQYSGFFSYNDITAFEKGVLTPNNENVKALRKLRRQAKEVEEYEDDEELDRICQDVADLIKGVVDYEA